MCAIKYFDEKEVQVVKENAKGKYHLLHGLSWHGGPEASHIRIGRLAD